MRAERSHTASCSDEDVMDSVLRNESEQSERPPHTYDRSFSQNFSNPPTGTSSGLQLDHEQEILLLGSGSDGVRPRLEVGRIVDEGNIEENELTGFVGKSLRLREDKFIHIRRDERFLSASDGEARR
jgi:hypothetical protein